MTTRVTRQRMRGAYFAGLALTVLSAAGCSGGTRTGAALERSTPTYVGAKPIKPGFEIGLLYYDIDNTSTSTIVINSVGIAGAGIGRVVRVVEMKMAPLRFGPHDNEPDAVPAALYTTKPPVFFEGHRCHRQALFPVRGFRMTPGSIARIWIVLRAIRSGRWNIPSQVIYYSVGNSRYQQSEPVRSYGAVANDAQYIKPDHAMSQCVKPGVAAFLAGYHADGH